MTLCVIDGKQCQCQPDEGVACTFGTPAQVQAAMWDEVMKYRKNAERYRKLRRGDYWSVIDSAGDMLHGDSLDAALDATPAVGAA